MASFKHQTVIEHRDDISRFMVHLTRDDRGHFSSGGNTARANLLAILSERTVGAYRAHCLHGAKLDTVAKRIRAAFRVACFTEVPLTQIHRIVGKIAGRSILLEPYGIVFRKETLIRAGAQPAMYINSYNKQRHVREGVDAIFASAKSHNFAGKGWRLLPFVNAMHETYDFTWEREWRIQGHFRFKASDIVCIILPDRALKLRANLNKRGLACIAPEWSYERIVEELASQHRVSATALKAIGRAKAAQKTEE